MTIFIAKTFLAISVLKIPTLVCLLGGDHFLGFLGESVKLGCHFGAFKGRNGEKYVFTIQSQ